MDINTKPDVLIIGGGIVGAAIFRECANNGLDTLLVERGDFGAQISAGSTEMAHGGFRYLMTLADWPLVFESLTERELLSRNAPHLVRPLNFYMPVYRGDGMDFDTSIPLVPKIPITIGEPGGFGMLMYQMGMMMYKTFAAMGLRFKGFMPDENEIDYKKYSRSGMLDIEPELNPEGLAGGFKFMDRKIEDVERLTMENILAGASAGGAHTLAMNYTEATDIDVDFARGTSTVEIHDTRSGRSHTIKPRFVVNATGIYIDNMIQRMGEWSGERIRKVSGIHLIVPRFWKNTDLRRAYAFWFDKKILFAISKGSDRILIGTTERDIDMDLDANPNRTFEKDIVEVARKMKKRFPGFEFDIERQIYYTRVRPLMREMRNKDPRAVSRRDFVEFHGSRAVSVTGKLGPSRHLAELVTKKIFTTLRPGDSYLHSHDIAYPGGFDGPLDSFIDSAAARHPGVAPDTLRRLIMRYGSRCSRALEYAESDADLAFFDPSPDALPACAYLFSWKEEMCANLADLYRRTGDNKFLGRGEDSAGSVAAYLGSKLGWDEEYIQKQVDSYHDFIGKRRQLVPSEPGA